jgi:hypothetical protein
MATGNESEVIVVDLTAQGLRALQERTLLIEAHRRKTFRKTLLGVLLVVGAAFIMLAST